MCGRYANHVGAMHGWADIVGDWPEQGELGFNIAPTQMIPVFTAKTGAAMRWGLIPPWRDAPDSQYATFNARLVTVAEKPAFRHAWRNNQRCLIPALGYYEWSATSGVKQPYFVRRRDDAPIMFGAIFEASRDGVPASCSILTRPAEGHLEPLHHAMPVMLEPEHAEAWFAGTPDEAAKAAWHTYPDVYHYYPVSSKVNKVANQGADLIDKAEEQRQNQQGFDF